MQTDGGISPGLVAQPRSGSPCECRRSEHRLPPGSTSRPAPGERSIRSTPARHHGRSDRRLQREVGARGVDCDIKVGAQQHNYDTQQTSGESVRLPADAPPTRPAQKHRGAQTSCENIEAIITKLAHDPPRILDGWTLVSGCVRNDNRRHRRRGARARGLDQTPRARRSMSRTRTRARRHVPTYRKWSVREDVGSTRIRFNFESVERSRQRRNRRVDNDTANGYQRIQQGTNITSRRTSRAGTRKPAA